MSHSIPVIVNASAGNGYADAMRSKLEEVFRSAGLEARVMTARSGDELKALVERTVREKPPAIVAGGGDGTINTVAAAVAQTDIALGVLPLGTLNHFAKDAGIPLDLQQAAHAIAGGHSIEVDVGQVNGRVFLNNSSLGLYPRIVRERDHRQGLLGHGKWWALLEATWATLRRTRLLHLRVCLDEREQRYDSTFVFIGNNEYIVEGLNIGARQKLDAGRLSLYTTQRRSRAGLLMLGLRALTGRLREAEGFDATTAQTIIVETRRRHVHVATDGEVNLLDTPLEYRVLPRALRVITPAAVPQRT